MSQGIVREFKLLFWQWESLKNYELQRDIKLCKEGLKARKKVSWKHGQ